ncbi:MAG: hypothetical protein U1F61_09960 [Opitutaceae bacterium]
MFRLSWQLLVVLGVAALSLPRAAAQDSWTISTIRPQTTTLSATAFGGGLWIAVGSNGVVLSSSNAVNWTTQNSGSTQGLRGAAYGAGRFVVVGTNGTILTSPDAVTWTPRTSGVSSNLYGVTFSGTLFVAVGVDGVIVTSPDGTTWTRRPSDPSGINVPFALLGITFGNGLYVIAGSEGTILTSPDAIAWTKRTSGTALWLYGAAFGNGRYMVVGDNGLVLESTNGTNWTVVDVVWPTDGSFEITESLQGVTFGGGGFVAVGFHGSIIRGTGGAGGAFQVALQGNTTSGIYAGVGFNGSQFLAVGDDGAMATSPTGTFWTGTLPTSVTQLNGVTTNGTASLVVASTPFQTGLTYFSTDGIVWNARARFYPQYATAFGAGTFVTAGGDLATSTDGVTWVDRTLPAGGSISLRGVVYGGGQFVAVGTGGMILTSPTGATWTQRTSGTTFDLLGVTYANGLFVAVGAPSALTTAVNLIRTSPDGVVWTARNSGLGNVTLRSVTYGGGLFVAVGAGGYSTSPDGLTWTARNPISTHSYNSIVYSTSRFTAVANGGAVYVSPDGLAWSSRSSGTNANLNGIALIGTQLLAVGSGEVLARSLSANSAPPVITTQPVSATVTAGQTAQFGFAASGVPTPTLQWQQSSDSGASWQDLTNGFPYSGVTTNTLSILSTTVSQSGLRFRGVATNTLNSATSNPAGLIVNEPVVPVVLTSPANQNVIVGQTATFIVSANGATPLSYQWQRLSAGSATWANLASSGNYGGATTPTLTVSNAALAMTGDQFRCVVSNAFGTATSGVGLLTVAPPPTPPTIVTDPAAQTATVGQAATFSVVATGTAPLSYQWQRLPAGGASWSNLSTTAVYSGVSTPTLTVSNTTVIMTGDSFRCVVSNAQGSANSLPAALSVSPPNQPPAFTTQPAAVTANSTASATFTSVATGNPAPTFQWQVSTDGGASWVAVPGATAASLTLNNLALSQNGYRYRVIATNSIGSATSSPALLTVNELILPTVITTPPVGGTFRSGQSLTLSVAATGTPPFTYAWFKNGQRVQGAAGASLGVGSLGIGDAGSYHVEVTGRGGVAASNGTQVSVIAPPVFTQQPVDAVVEAGLNTSFIVAVSASPAATLQWYSRTGVAPWQPVADAPPFSGATTPILSINGAGASIDGLQVQARATNAGGTTDSLVATLDVAGTGTGLRIAGQPQSQVVRSGQAVTFSVAMEGTGPFSYQWRKDGASISGATTGFYTINAATSDSAGGYSVVVRDTTGLSTTSNSAFLTVAGAVDPSFNPLGGPNGEVTQMLALADGGYLIAGSFDRVAGVPRKGVARLQGDGSVDLAFDPGTGPNGAIQALLELSSSRFLAVGQFDRYNGAVVPGVVRITGTGALDPGFVPDLPTPAGSASIPVLERFHTTVIGLQGGGYLLGGRAGIVALSPSGVPNPQSVLPTNGPVAALVQQFNGGILVGGDFTLINGFVRPRLARLQTTFILDQTYDVGTGPNGIVQSLLRSPDGSIYVLGKFTQFNGQPRPSGIARIGPTGALDLAFNPPLSPLTASEDMSSVSSAGGIRPAGGRLDAIRAGQVQPNGGLAVTNGSGLNQSVVALSPSGAVSSEVNVQVQGAANTLAASADEDLVVGGTFSAIAGTDRSSVGAFTDASEGSRLTNLSCRSRVTGNSSLLILGFVIDGPESMRVLVRGVGPTLRSFGVTDALNRPQLTIYNGAGQVIMENRSWRVVPDPDGLAQAMAQVGAFALNFTDDTAVLLNLNPGSYTAHISGQSGSSGVALGEIYAVDQGRSRLVNSSVRGNVGTGENVLIPGFTVAGGSRLILLRAAGPALDQFNVPDTLDRPAMVLRHSSGFTISSNQGWTTGFDPAAVQARAALVGAFPFTAQSADSAVLVALDAGGYTVTVAGADGGTGAALVEAYDANGILRSPTNQ